MVSRRGGGRDHRRSCPAIRDHLRPLARRSPHGQHRPPTPRGSGRAAPPRWRPTALLRVVAHLDENLRGIRRSHACVVRCHRDRGSRTMLARGRGSRWIRPGSPAVARHDGGAGHGDVGVCHPVLQRRADVHARRRPRARRLPRVASGPCSFHARFPGRSEFCYRGVVVHPILGVVPGGGHGHRPGRRHRGGSSPWRIGRGASARAGRGDDRMPWVRAVAPDVRVPGHPHGDAVVGGIIPHVRAPRRARRLRRGRSRRRRDH